MLQKFGRVKDLPAVKEVEQYRVVAGRKAAAEGLKRRYHWKAVIVFCKLF
jgi:hypothetical protein